MACKCRSVVSSLSRRIDIRNILKIIYGTVSRETVSLSPDNKDQTVLLRYCPFYLPEPVPPPKEWKTRNPWSPVQLSASFRTLQQSPKYTVIHKFPDPATEALNMNQPVFEPCNRGPNLLKIRIVFQVQLNAIFHKACAVLYQSFGTIPLNCYDFFCLVAGQNMLYIRHCKTVRETIETLAFWLVDILADLPVWPMIEQELFCLLCSGPICSAVYLFTCNGIK